MLKSKLEKKLSKLQTNCMHTRSPAVLYALKVLLGNLYFEFSNTNEEACNIRCQVEMVQIINKDG